MDAHGSADALGEGPSIVSNPGSALTISEVSQRTGIAPATLRVWQERYGLSPSRTTVGGHRRYSTSDVTRLRTVQRMIANGSSAGEAVRAVMAGARADTSLPWLVLDSQARPAARQLGDACFHLDGPTCSALLRELLARDGVVATWEHVLRPVLGAVGEQWSKVAHGIAVEHMLSHIAAVVLAETVRPRERPPRPTVFLACAPGELHDLPLVALHSALAPAGIDSILFGARTPNETLISAAEQRHPAAVVIFSLLPDWADVHSLQGFAADLPVLAAGPGWNHDRLPSNIGQVDDLVQAQETIAALTS
jgi:DNA-binding transcriptional MerR regulator